jgi:AcrR family transcriptional regulator
MIAASAADGTASTPERLLEVAIRAIETGGERSVNVRRVAGACGVTSPIVYKAYGSREGLVVAAQAERFRRSIADNVALFSRAIDAAGTVEELRAVMVRLVAAASDPSRIGSRQVQYEVLGAAVHRADLRKAVDEAMRSLIDQATAALERARQRGLVRADVALPELVWWFVGQIQGRRLVEQSEAVVDHEAWVRTATEALLAVLFGG